MMDKMIDDIRTLNPYLQERYQTKHAEVVRLYRETAAKSGLADDPARLNTIAAALVKARDARDALPDTATIDERIDADILAEKAEALYDGVLERWNWRMIEQQQRRRRDTETIALKRRAIAKLRSSSQPSLRDWADRIEQQLKDLEND